MSIFRVSSILFLSVALTTGCSRPTAKIFEQHPIEYKINAQDRAIPLSEIKKMHVLDISGSVATADLFEYLDTMQNLGKNQKNIRWSLESEKLFAQFYQSPRTSSHVEFQDSPYADFIIAKSKNDFLKASRNLDEIFAKQQLIVKNTLAELSNNFVFPKEDISISQALQLIADYMSLFETEFQKSEADKAVKEGVLGGLYQKFWLKLPATSAIVSKMDAAASLQDAIKILRSLVQELDVELTSAQEETLKSAAELGQMLNQDLDPQGAFTILVNLWEQMTDLERKETFGEVSPDLYKFLSGQRRKHRDCLKKPDCNNLVLEFSKQFIILPNLKKYGVEKMRRNIQNSALESVKSQTSSMATALVKELPKILEDEINKGLALEHARFAGYRQNYDGFVRGELKNWFDKRFAKSALAALETDRLQVSSVKNGLQFEGALSNESNFITSADAIGLALSSTSLIGSKGSDAQLVGLTRVNQLLAHGGFSLYDGKSFPSLMRELFKNGMSRPQNIENLFAWPSLFAMPTPVKIEHGFQLPQGIAPENFMILSQARLLKGFAKMMNAFRDWAPAKIGDLISEFKAKDLLGSLPADDLNISAFPKDAFLAISLGNASAILSNLKANGSPLFIMCQDHSLIWADKGHECPHATALAGVIDIIKNKRQMRVDTLSQAEFLESLIEFIKNAEQAALTKSEYLVNRTGGENAPIEELKKSLPQLRSLALGMTNLISHVLESSEGRIFTSYDLKDSLPASEPAQFSTQIATIQALLTASEHFNLKSYKMSAINAYLYLNRELWDSNSGFYRLGGGRRASRLDLARAVRALRPLVDEPLLSKDSRIQLQNLIDVWLSNL